MFTSASIGIAFGRGQYDEPGRDHARRRHGDVSRQGARQGAARAVRRRHARARARSPRPRERSAPRGRQQRLRGALPADRVADDRRCASASSRWCAGRATASRFRRPRSSRSPRSSGSSSRSAHGCSSRRAARLPSGSGSFRTAGLECITVNVSSRQLMQQNFLRIVEQAVPGRTGARAIFASRSPRRR